MSHGDRKKQRLAQKEARRRPDKPARGRCALCKKLNPKSWTCPESQNGHLILEEE